MKWLFCFVFILLRISSVCAQDNDILLRLSTSNAGEGKVVVVQDAGIADMIKMHVEQNKQFSTLEGYRIQIYSSSSADSKKTAQEMKAMAMAAFPDQKVYLTYTAPFWRVRVGNFRNKSESMQVYHQLKKSFPNCYPIKDSGIKIQDLQ
jgi:hypothetical protein